MGACFLFLLSLRFTCVPRLVEYTLPCLCLTFILSGVPGHTCYRHYVGSHDTYAVACRRVSCSGSPTDPDSQKAVYGVPLSVVGKNDSNLQMVWGTGTYGVQRDDMDQFWSLWQIDGASEKLMTYVGDMGAQVRASTLSDLRIGVLISLADGASAVRT